MRISDWSSDVCSSDLYHFIAEGRSWNPYLLAGLGYQRAEEEFDNFPNPDSPIQREDGHVADKLGVGVQSTFDNRVAVRAELAYRIDADNDSYAALASDPNHDDGEDWFGDILASVGVVIPLGPAPTAPRSEEHTSEHQSLMRISYAV